MVKVSIIVPVYNMGDTLGSCLNSLLKQSYSNLEIIVVDDGSDDNTFEVCQEFKQYTDKIKSFHIENSGSGPARNYGITKATGDYVYFMDADDILEPHAIEVLVSTAINQKSDLVVFGYKKVDSKGKVVFIKDFDNEDFSGDFVRDNYHLFFDMNFKRGIQGAPWNKFFDLKLIKKHNIKFPALKRHQDEVFISRYVNFTKKVSFINDILYTHFLNDFSSKIFKFPVNYIDIVKELYKYRLDIIGEWNKSNKKVQSLIYVEYIYNTLKAFDIIFSKKAGMNKKDRIHWIIEEVNVIPVKKELVQHSGYNSKIKLEQILTFLELVEKRSYKKIYIMIKIRVTLQSKFSLIIHFLKKRMVKKLKLSN